MPRHASDVLLVKLLKRLRETTFDVYQIYAHRTETEILELLGKYGTTHILATGLDIHIEIN